MLLKEIVKNESPEDFVTYFGLIMDYPSLDTLYTYNRFEVIENSRLLNLYLNLLENGTFGNKGAKVIKGPNWKEPQFVTEKKYDLSEFSKKIPS